MPTPYYRNPYREGSHSWRAEQSTTIENFAGGLNNVDADVVIADNESPNCRNMRFLGSSLMEKRPGTKNISFKNSSYLIDAVTWIDTWNTIDGDEIFVVSDGFGIISSNSTGVRDVEGNIHGVTYNGKYYFVDGKNLYVMLPDQTAYKIVTAPIAHVTKKVSNTVVNVDKIPPQTKVGDPVFITGGALRTEENFVSKIKSISGNSITLEDELTSALVYKAPILFYDPGDESATSGKEVWNDETAMAYYNPCLNELGDFYAGEPYMPDSPSVIAVHKNRLFIAGDSSQPHAVYCSSISTDGAQPLYFPSGIFLQTKPDGKPIVDLVVFDDALIIGRNKDLYVLYGSSEYLDDSDDPFYIKQMDATVGFMNTDCGALLNNFYIFLGYDGRFYKLNTPTTFVEYLVTRPLPFKCDIYSDPIGIAPNSVVRTSTTAYKNEVYFNLNEDLTVVYNYDNQAFTFYTGWKSSALYSDGSRLYIGRTDKLIAVQCDDNPTYKDLDEPIDACYETKRFTFCSPASKKYFKSFSVTSKISEDTISNIDVNVEIDYYRLNEKIVINSNPSLFGVAQWGIDAFGSAELKCSTRQNLDARGRTIKYIFSNNAISNNGKGEFFRLYAVNTLWSARDVR